MFGRRIPKAPVRQPGPRPGANPNCCVRTVPGQQPQRPQPQQPQRPVQRPNPFRR